MGSKELKPDPNCKVCGGTGYDPLGYPDGDENKEFEWDGCSCVVKHIKKEE